ncbi:MAG: RNA recognition motif domain-containing protein [Campylobacterales bacterium]
MKSIYVGNIPFKATEEELSDLFAQYGEVDSVKFINDRESGKFRGFGFVEMIDDTEADKAIDAISGKEFMGRNLKVNPAKPREPRAPRNDGF